MRRLREIVDAEDDHVLAGDLILLEVPQGGRDEALVTRIERTLRRYPIAPMPDDTIAVQAARNFRGLRARGITVRNNNDMIIGTFCIAGGHPPLHDDRDFEPMAAHLGLRTVPVRSGP